MRWVGIVAVAAAVLALGAVAATPAVAVGAAQPTLVSTVPASFTPDIANGTVYSIAQVGSWIVVGGSFTSVTPHGSSAVARTRVLAFDQSTGALDTGFAPNVDGTVNAVWPGPTVNTVYVGGAFSAVNGAASKSLALLSLSNGAAVSGFQVPAMNGIVDDIRLSGGHLFLVGSFTVLGGVSHPGIATLDPTSGAVDSYVSISLTGHHNYNGSGASGAVGGRALDINAAGTKAVVVGDFKLANGMVHDQIVMLDLGTSSAAVDANWNTNGFTGACASSAFDTYVEDVDFSPDGSYYAVATTGGGGISYNPDGSRSLCDTATRWETNASGTNVQPTWVDYTGNDTFWSVTVTGTAVYEGGHQRWVNNPNGSDNVQAGAVPRPGIVALDPNNGLPFSWNPGRNPRGAGAYALLATSQGLYVGSDTDYIGNFQYKRQKIAYFPVAGGETPPSTSTASLPANLYVAGGLPGGSTTGSTANTLSYRPVSGSTVGASTPVSTSVAWGSTRGAFPVGDYLFWPDTSGNLNRATFNDTTLGTPTVLDAYDDPAWSSVQTGSGQTYRGAKSNWYSKINSITGAFYSNGRVYYSLSGHTALYWRYFESEDGIIGATEFSVSGADFSIVDGMTLSGSTIYYASRVDGTLRTYPFTNGMPTSAGGTTISAPGVDWRARSLFLYGSSTANQSPVARVTVSCFGLTCSFDGTGSSDPDGSIGSYAWTFGDSSTGSGSTVSHSYAGAGSNTVTLTVTDNRGATNTWSGTATTTTTGGAVGFVGDSGYDGVSAAPTVAVPTGTQTGSSELLFVSTGSAGVTQPPTGLTGWTQISKLTNYTLETTVYRRTATSGDAGTAVTVPLSSSARVDMQLAVYSGVDPGTLPLTTKADYTTATHVSPSNTVSTAGSWVLTYWSDRSTGTTAWTFPAGSTLRKADFGTGGGAVSGAVTDSGADVVTGAYASLTATTNATSGRGNAISVVLPPAS